ncbi:MAG: Rrf2 family transcriptional regulator [Sphingomonadaceae bacterium]|nr:Rrf2 family transcriptional regulator [Sphingomonadaceae bacterium]
MQLTQHTDYGLRLLIVLARSDGAPLSLVDFAREQGLSYNHIAKVARALGQHGYIISHRGRNGGVSLALPAQEIRIGDVVRALEFGMKLADCGNCALQNNCATSSLLAQALAAFLAILDRANLADMARDGPPAVRQWFPHLASSAGTAMP